MQKSVSQSSGGGIRSIDSMGSREGMLSISLAVVEVTNPISESELTQASGGVGIESMSQPECSAGEYSITQSGPRWSAQGHDYVLNP